MFLKTDLRSLTDFASLNLCDVLPDCQTVIVLARRFLNSTLFATSTIPYTDVRNKLTRQMDELAIELAYILESREALAVPINAIGGI